MIIKNQILYLLNEVLCHNSDILVKDDDVIIESQIINFKINNNDFKETVFDFYDAVLNEEDHRFLDDIKDKINNCELNINSLWSVLKQVNIQQVNWLKITAFFINEAYLNKNISYDIHNRVSSNEITTKYIPYLEFPVVDIISKLFCANLIVKQKNNFQINFTCDYDILNNWSHIGRNGFLKRILRHFFRLQFITLIKELISLKLADKELKWNFYLNDKMFIDPLANSFRNFEVQNIAFMLMNKDNPEYDVNNNFETNAFKTFLTEVKKKFNLTIGLHPNYDTTKKPELLPSQIEKFNNVFGFAPEISRFHYLKCNFPNDLSILENNNIKYDYSFGFANSLLFRGGRTFPVKLWDSNQNRVQNIVSVPLSIMDTTLNDYLYLTYEEALEACKSKILYSVAFGSSLTLLWHNHNMYPYHRPFNYHSQLLKKLITYIEFLDKKITEYGYGPPIMCTKCILDSHDDPEIQFDAQGICNHCHTYDIAVKKYVLHGLEAKNKLDNIVKSIQKDGKGKKYDCIIGVSGGVDSTYVAYLSKQFKLRPLAVHLDNGWNSELAVQNIENIIKKLDIDLETYVIDWEEFKDLQLSYLKASVVDIEATTDHAIFASLYNTAYKYNIKYILQGVNIVTEGLLPSHWIHNKFDLLNIRSIHKKFGTIPLKTYPQINILQKLFYEKIKKIKFIPILNYADYNKDDAKKIIIEQFGWRDYGGKHYESIFTRFYQAYILPQKFGIDKRKSHYSTLICSGQLKKDNALLMMQEDVYENNKLLEDKEYVIKKFGLSEIDFETIMTEPAKFHSDYPSYLNYYYSVKKIIRSSKNFFNS